MMKVEKLIRIPLQFFGESEDDFDDDLGYEDEGAAEDYEEDEGGADAADDEGADASGEDGDADDRSQKSDTDHADLIADLKALGFKGDDLDSLKASVKARRESMEKNAASEERAAAQAEGKSHVKSGKPARGASGEGLSGFTERDIAEVNACLKNPRRGEKGRARAALERAVRAK